MDTDEQEFEKAKDVIWTHCMLAMAVPWITSLTLGTLLPNTPAGWIAPTRRPGYLPITLGELPYALAPWIVGALLLGVGLVEKPFARKDGRLDPWRMSRAALLALPWISYALAAAMGFCMRGEMLLLGLTCAFASLGFAAIPSKKNGMLLWGFVWTSAAMLGPFNLHCVYIKYFLIR